MNGNVKLAVKVFGLIDVAYESYAVVIGSEIKVYNFEYGKTPFGCGIIVSAVYMENGFKFLYCISKLYTKSHTGFIDDKI